MIEVEVNGHRYKIFRCDALNLSVCEYRMVKGRKGHEDRMDWVHFAYAGNPAAAARSIYRREGLAFVEREESYTLKQAVEELEKIQEAIVEQVKGAKFNVKN